MEVISPEGKNAAAPPVSSHISKLQRSQRRLANADRPSLLYTFPVLVSGVTLRLTTPFRVALYGTEVRHFDHYAMERPGEARREWVVSACEGEAASAGVTSAEAWSRTEGQLVHGGSEACSCNPAS